MERPFLVAGFLSFLFSVWLYFVLGVGDLALRPLFNRIADRAATGLCVAIQGTKV